MTGTTSQAEAAPIRHIVAVQPSETRIFTDVNGNKHDTYQKADNANKQHALREFIRAELGPMDPDDGPEDYIARFAELIDNHSDRFAEFFGWRL